jgi:hypothetical protein
VVYDETGIAERSIERRNQAVYGIGRRAEEVEVARLPVNFTPRDQCSATREGEAFGLLQASDDPRDLLLKRAQHLRAWMSRDPPRPRLANRRRQHELVPELEEVVGVDVEAHVVLSSLAEHLLVDSSAVASVVEVVRERWPAPANVERKLDATSCLWF